MLRKYSDFIILVVVGTMIGTIYSAWFYPFLIIGGDWWFLHKEMLSDFAIIPTFWRSQEGFPAGGVNTNFPFYSYAHVVIGLLVNTFGFSWNIVSKFFYFYLFIVLSIFSIIKLLRSIYQKVTVWQISLGFLIYLTNTYILLVTNGGQMGIALSYAIAPFVLNRIIVLVQYVLLKKNSLIPSLALGLAIAIQVVFDIRIAYMTVLASLVFIVLFAIIVSIKKTTLLKYLLLSAFVATALHAFWIIPFALYNLLKLPVGITSIDSFNFFSFAYYENTLGLLHPNWPENIFGKIYFMKWEFLIIPIIAFSSLFFYNSSRIKNGKLNQVYIAFFLLVAIIGSFLAKGMGSPFGFINKFAYELVPGMNLFRDPTKFYLLTALAYAVLIPFSIDQISHWLTKRFHLFVSVKMLVISCFLVYWLFLLSPVWHTELGGTFKKREVPEYYRDFAVSTHNELGFFRTLWIPTQTRYRYQSELHPLINSESLFSPVSHEDHINKLLMADTKDKIDALSVKYIVLPVDSDHELFLTDRKYDESIRDNYKHVLDSISWLVKIQDSPLDVYENKTYREHLLLENGRDLSWNRISSSEYQLGINTHEATTLHFSESYHSQWVMKVRNITIYPKQSEYGTMLFEVPSGEFKAKISFLPERYKYIGDGISIITLIGVIVVLVRIRNNS